MIIPVRELLLTCKGLLDFNMVFDNASRDDFDFKHD